MLLELHVRDFALIERLDLIFGPGLNILTGETGAGKSIVIDALSLALGERAPGSEVVRTGAERASVEAVFDIPEHNSELMQRVADLGLEVDEGLLIVARELGRGSGKSQCRINGRLTPVSVLKEIGDSLVDVHGQHEHQSLLRTERHIDILDDWARSHPLRDEVGRLVDGLRGLRAELDRLHADARERARNLDLYRFQCDEIDEAKLAAGEEEELTVERSRLANAEKLFAAAAESYDSLTGGDSARGAVDALNGTLVSIEHALAVDESLAPVVELLRSAVSYAEDAARDLRRYRDGIAFSPERLEEIEARLDSLRGLKRKYGETIPEILAYRAELGAKLSTLENSEAREEELGRAIEKAAKAVGEVSARLTAVREQAGADFARRISAELADLGMTARFEVSIEPMEPGRKGADKVEFLLSANPGEPLRPLARIASGGEMSRIMLAIKSVMASVSRVPTMIFDEIDVGVGGRTAQVIADKLDSLGGQAQILIITHLPQIAARADMHFSIEKRVENGRSIVSVNPLDSEARVDEIARMLGGTRRSDAVFQHAREMLAR